MIVLYPYNSQFRSKMLDKITNIKTENWIKWSMLKYSNIPVHCIFPQIPLKFDGKNLK